jgi:hypothetical protein
LADIDAVAVIEAYVVADGITHARPLASANDQPGANGTSHLVSNFGTVRWTDAAAFEQSDACAHGVADERTISCADKATVACSNSTANAGTERSPNICADASADAGAHVDSYGAADVCRYDIRKPRHVADFYVARAHPER